MASCQVTGEGVGTERYLTLTGGGEIRDTIEAIDVGKRRLIDIPPVSPFPVTDYQGTIEVFDSCDGLGVVFWIIDIESKHEDAA